MPIYEYALLEGEEHSCEYCQHGFEIIQKISDKALTSCPKCEAACGKILSGFSVAGQTDSNLLNDSNLAAKGFTKYKKVAQGTYEKTTGKGPRIIKR